MFPITSSDICFSFSGDFPVLSCNTISAPLVTPYPSTGGLLKAMIVASLTVANCAVRLPKMTSISFSAPRSFLSFNLINPMAYAGLALFDKILKPVIVVLFCTDSVFFKISSTRAAAAVVRSSAVPGGMLKLKIIKESSSIGTKLLGVLLIIQPARAVIRIIKPAPIHFFTIKNRNPLIYLPVKFSKPALNAVKNRFPNPFSSDAPC
ncbi:hypothetical protein D3C86_1169220 [compost metagenome]